MVVEYEIEVFKNFTNIFKGGQPRYLSFWGERDKINWKVSEGHYPSKYLCIKDLDFFSYRSCGLVHCARQTKMILIYKIAKYDIIFVKYLKTKTFLPHDAKNVKKVVLKIYESFQKCMTTTWLLILV